VTDLLPLACTLHHAGYALILHHNRLYALRGRAMWRVTDLATAATALHPSRWGEA